MHFKVISILFAATAILFLITMPENNVHAQSKHEKQVAEAVQQLRKAMIDGDRAQLENLASESLTYGHSSGKMEDKAAFVDAIASGTSDFVTMDLTDQKIIIKDKTALVRHNLSAETKDNGRPGTAKLGVLLVWQKERGKWKLLARQAFRL